MSVTILENKIQFEKDLLQVLDKYGFNIKGITRIKIDAKVDCFPEVGLTYFKQNWSLKSHVLSIYRSLYIKFVYLFNNVR